MSPNFGAWLAIARIAMDEHMEAKGPLRLADIDRLFLNGDIYTLMDVNGEVRDRKSDAWQQRDERVTKLPEPSKKGFK